MTAPHERDRRARAAERVAVRASAEAHTSAWVNARLYGVGFRLAGRLSTLGWVELKSERTGPDGADEVFARLTDAGRAQLSGG